MEHPSENVGNTCPSAVVQLHRRQHHLPIDRRLSDSRTAGQDEQQQNKQQQKHTNYHTTNRPIHCKL